jgi:hypothetical protein
MKNDLIFAEMVKATTVHVSIEPFQNVKKC